MSIQIKGYNLEFLHLPKTGGVWVEKALLASGVRLARLGHEHGNYDRVLSEQISCNGWISPRFGRRISQFRRKTGRPVEQPRRFCFVRNPFHWYESYWRFMMEHDWFMYGYPNDPERWHPWADLLHIQEKDFIHFIQRVLCERPGYLTQLYQSFCKPGITYIGKTENLACHLEEILRRENVKHDSSALESHKKTNTSDKIKLPIEWDPELRKQLFFTELNAFLAFDYVDDETSPWITKTGLDTPPNFAHESLLSV